MKKAGRLTDAQRERQTNRERKGEIEWKNFLSFCSEIVPTVKLSEGAKNFAQWKTKLTKAIGFFSEWKKKRFLLNKLVIDTGTNTNLSKTKITHFYKHYQACRFIKKISKRTVGGLRKRLTTCSGCSSSVAKLSWINIPGWGANEPGLVWFPVAA